jgi:hypothetical protein
MQLNAFDVLIGLRLSIIRRAADMLVLHFGTVRPHYSGEGSVAYYALHIQCPWRIDSPSGTLTGRDDLWEYAGPGERPSNWSYDDGLSLLGSKVRKHLCPRREYSILAQRERRFWSRGRTTYRARRHHTPASKRIRNSRLPGRLRRRSLAPLCSRERASCGVPNRWTRLCHFATQEKAWR